MKQKIIRKISSAVIYGDSISTKNHGKGGYESLIKQKLKIGEIYNHAVGSSGISRTTPNSLVSLLEKEENIHKDADLIIIWHGSNDWYWGVPMGDIAKNDDNTFNGALKAVIIKLRRFSPNAIILFLTPIFRYEIPDKCFLKEEGYINKNLVNLTLKDYHDAIVNASIILGFTNVNMRGLTNFHYYNAEKYFEDYIHPTEAGYKKIADIITKSINLLSFE